MKAEHADFSVLTDWVRRHPRRSLFWLVLAVALALGLSVTVMPHGPWRLYHLQWAGIELLLPAEPELVSDPALATFTVGDVRTPRLAVMIVAAGHAAPEMQQPDPAAALVRRAMDLLSKRPDVSDLSYMSGRNPNSRQVLRIFGTFRRDGVPCEVSGCVLKSAVGAAQVLCFFSDQDGAAAAKRVLRSVQARAAKAD
jgi:hypothetical protein